MDIRQEMTFTGGRLPKIAIEIGGEGEEDKVTLVIKGVLSREAAVILGCDYLYTQDFAAVREGLKEVRLDFALPDMEFKLQTAEEINTFYPEVIDGLKIFKINVALLGIQATVEHKGFFDDLLDFFRKVRDKEFTFIIRPRQGQLFEGEGGVTGTRVEMGEGGMAEVLDEITATAEATSETADLTDRSYENTPKKRGRPKKVVEINEQAQPEKDAPIIDSEFEEVAPFIE